MSPRGFSVDVLPEGRPNEPYGVGRRTSGWSTSLTQGLAGSTALATTDSRTRATGDLRGAIGRKVLLFDVSETLAGDPSALSRCMRRRRR
ncbi:hypothetical protein OM076_00930 [Solirubrobacter ginsenosidimutans]|uniref:Uncharacterized protein n=1 Tax=Solirubrobacter ginsenosidimutans TaxID=490573 RepID=A0A9X3MN65_9ACTN|nr:hypothetical protein [Solirubrobacter ginsenosidimutans]